MILSEEPAPDTISSEVCTKPSDFNNFLNLTGHLMNHSSVVITTSVRTLTPLTADSDAVILDVYLLVRIMVIWFNIPM